MKEEIIDICVGIPLLQILFSTIYLAMWLDNIVVKIIATIYFFILTIAIFKSIIKKNEPELED